MMMRQVGVHEMRHTGGGVCWWAGLLVVCFLRFWAFRGGEMLLYIARVRRAQP